METVNPFDALDTLSNTLATAPLPEVQHQQHRALADVIRNALHERDSLIEEKEDAGPVSPQPDDKTGV